ncbi:MAG: type II toxin-antitoxin system RelE/ParE family toxin [Alkalinema sp. CAN_BIN05]|nr:type II toxin-antitoxin system RelE/ParE family toxin [Alkalinema sp. CAN_BIN05]
MAELPKISIIATPDFQTQLRRFAKRYRSLQSDLQTLFAELQNGNCPGDQIPGTFYTVFKVRIKNSDIQKGKSAGYRVIYQLKNNICILLITLYSKSDESSITAREIRAIIERFDKLSETSTQEPNP